MKVLLCLSLCDMPCDFICWSENTETGFLLFGDLRDVDACTALPMLCLCCAWALDAHFDIVDMPRSGFEPLTRGFSVHCSNQLSYLGLVLVVILQNLLVIFWSSLTIVSDTTESASPHDKNQRSTHKNEKRHKDRNTNSQKPQTLLYIPSLFCFLAFLSSSKLNDLSPHEKPTSICFIWNYIMSSHRVGTLAQAITVA